MTTPFTVVTLLRVPEPTVIPFKDVTPDNVVTFGCEAVCSVPVKLVALTAVDETLLRPLNVPEPTVIPFKDVTPANVVTFGCEAVCKVPVRLVAVIPVDDTLVRPLNVPEPTVIPFKDVTPANVVIFGCEAVLRVPATVLAVNVPTTSSPATPLVKSTTLPEGATVRPLRIFQRPASEASLKKAEYRAPPLVYKP